jgi:hypothetical protein
MTILFRLLTANYELNTSFIVSLLVTLNARMAMTNSRNNTTYEMGTPWSRPGDFKSSVRVDVSPCGESLIVPGPISLVCF